MKFSIHWLAEWVSPLPPTAELAAQLTAAGLEVEAIARVAPDLAGVVVGRIEALQAVAGTQALNLCRVDVGTAQALSVVTAAANARHGLCVPVALPGTRLPDGRLVAAHEVHGMHSAALFCSTKELGLAEEADGIWELPPDAVPGTPLAALLGLDDHSMELSVTPNRGDCLSLLGIAREIAAAQGLSFTPPAVTPVIAAHQECRVIRVEDSSACPRYLGRIVRGLHRDAMTPLWMQERLRRSGIRAIHPAVDVTNYVLLEWGQPMHAFDLERLEGEIVVRRAHPGEPAHLLDGRCVALDPSTLVIADDLRVHAIAGVMGGQHAAVGPATRDVFLECAHFTPRAVAGQARRYGLATESSRRFERGVDPQLPSQVMERATALLLAIAGGTPGPIIDLTEPAAMAARAPILLRPERAARLLGMPLNPQRMTALLTRLGLAVRMVPEGLQVTPLSARFDLTIEADLIEELARMLGYNALPQARLATPARIASQSERRVPLARVRALFADRGYHEAITYAFTEPGLQARLHPDRRGPILANPITHDLAVMRTSLWPGLLSALRYNLHRQQARVRLFEVGTCFIDADEIIHEKSTLSGVAYGGAYPEQWGEPMRASDFYDVKADLDALAHLARQPVLRCEAAHHPALHPGQSARLYAGDQAVGWLGALHPEHARSLDIPGAVFCFELRLDPLLDGALPSFSELSKFPALRRDLAVVLDATIPVQTVCDTVRQCTGDTLRDVIVFDVYQGEGVASGQRSIALGLLFQRHAATLDEAEISASLARLTLHLQTTFQAKLRGERP